MDGEADPRSVKTSHSDGHPSEVSCVWVCCCRLSPGRSKMLLIYFVPGRCRCLGAVQGVAPCRCRRSPLATGGPYLRYLRGGAGGTCNPQSCTYLLLRPCHMHRAAPQGSLQPVECSLTFRNLGGTRFGPRLWFSLVSFIVPSASSVQWQFLLTAFLALLLLRFDWLVLPLISSGLSGAASSFPCTLFPRKPQSAG
jgi:hypothetical protein